jgi:regulator of RNase E activity RraA
VAFSPGAVFVGASVGLVVTPPHRAAAGARDATEQEKMEAFILERVEGGAKLAGTYPPNAETRAAYEVWRKERDL